MTNNSQNSILFFIKSILIGIALFALVALFAAFVEIQLNAANAHPHGMEGLLYFLLPMFCAPVGALLGAILAWRHRREKDLKTVLKELSIGTVVFFVVLVLIASSFRN